MNRLRKWLLVHLWWIALLISLAFLISHSFRIARVAVDNTTLILLGIILLCPWLAALKRIKIGDFEAEIESAEVKRLTEDASKALPELEASGAAVPTPHPAGQAIRQLAEHDPIIALAKLRIEIERAIKRLATRLGDTRQRGMYQPLSRLIRDLAAEEVLPQELAGPLREAIAICNRAIHGEEIRDRDAMAVIGTGTDLLDALDRIAREYAAMHPEARQTITGDEVDTYQSSRYRITTIVPLVKDPQRLTYVLTQEELDGFFEGYSEFAEFVVALERLEDNGAAQQGAAGGGQNRAAPERPSR